MKKITQKEFDEIVEQHKLWLNDNGGARAVLYDADLTEIDFGSANLSSADLSFANLSSANLRSANLRYADLSSANLSGIKFNATIGNCREIKSLFVSETYPIVYTDKYLQIGCERHAINDWWEFDDDRIDDMDDGALEWWKEWKGLIRNAIELSPAKSTGYKDKESEVA